VLTIDLSVLKRGYRFALSVELIVGVVLVIAGLDRCKWPLGIGVGIVGGLLSSLAVVGFLRSASVECAFTDDGIVFRGPWSRRSDFKWADIEYAGWLVYPQVALYGRDVLVPMFKPLGKRWPLVVPVSHATIAQASGADPRDVLRGFESDCLRRGVDFKQRIPDISPYLYSWSAAALMSGVVIGGTVAWTRLC
jgi:hypothetical protein